MIWEKLLRVLKEEQGYGSAELLILVAGIAAIGYMVATSLISGVFAPMHEKSVEKMTNIRNSGY